MGPLERLCYSKELVKFLTVFVVKNVVQNVSFWQKPNGLLVVIFCDLDKSVRQYEVQADSDDTAEDSHDAVLLEETFHYHLDERCHHPKDIPGLDTRLSLAQ